MRPTATFWNPNLYNPLPLYPVYTATQTSYIHLSIVNIACTDWSFNFLKIYTSPAFWMVIKEQLCRSQENCKDVNYFGVEMSSEL